MTSPEAERVAWRPLSQRGWTGMRWLASDTWIGPHRVFARIAPDGDPDLPPLLMLHGAVVSGAYFGPIAVHLDDRFRVYVPDLPGFGRSRAQGRLTIAEHVDVLNRWMEVHGLHEAVVIGNSTGCQVATELAARYPDRVSRLVLLAPTMDPDISGLVSLLLRGAMDIPRERQRLWTIWLPDLLASGVRRGVHHVRDALRDEQIDRLSQVGQGVVCVAGERDPICPPAWVEALGQRFSGGRVHVIAGAPHALNYSSADGLARIIMAMDLDAADEVP